MRDRHESAPYVGIGEARIGTTTETAAAVSPPDGLPPHHPAREFTEQRYAKYLPALAEHVREAIEANGIAPLGEDQIMAEVRLLTAVMGGIGLQRLRDPSTDVEGTVTVCVDRVLAAWSDSAVRDAQHRHPVSRRH